MSNNIKMLKTLKGVRDGQIYPDTFLEGETYNNVDDSLVEAFVDAGACELAEDTNEAEEKTVDTMTNKELIVYAAEEGIVIEGFVKLNVSDKRAALAEYALEDSDNGTDAE